jgi:hypothetical protein
MLIFRPSFTIRRTVLLEVLVALISQFGTISDELQEWFYMAKGKESKPSSETNYSDAKFTDKPDYFIQPAEKK